MNILLFYINQWYVHMSNLETQVWCPFKLGDIEEIEKIQKRATILIISLKNKPYKERLMHLKFTYIEI